MHQAFLLNPPIGSLALCALSITALTNVTTWVRIVDVGQVKGTSQGKPNGFHLGYILVTIAARDLLYKWESVHTWIPWFPFMKLCFSKQNLQAMDLFIWKTAVKSEHCAGQSKMEWIYEQKWYPFVSADHLTHPLIPGKFWWSSAYLMLEFPWQAFLKPALRLGTGNSILESFHWRFALQ